MSDPSAPEGGFRDRLIFEGFHKYLHDKLDAIGWFGPIGAPAKRYPPIVWRTERIPDDETIPEDALVVSTDDVDIADLEIGSNASATGISVWIDFYPVNDALGAHVAGDIIAILRGQMTAVNAVEPNFPVFDTDGLTELFTVDIEDIQLLISHNPSKPAERYWRAVACVLVDERA